MRPIDADESLAWSKNLEALRAGVAARKPDAVDRVKLQVRKLERELGPLALTLAVMQAKARTGVDVDDGRVAAIIGRMDKLRAQLDDLRPILRNIKAVPRADDDGPTSEVAARPTIAYDVPEDLRPVAEDLRCGWLVRTAGLSAAISSYDELRTRGEPGRVAERLERNYVGWRAQMAHSRLPLWPTELVVCEGKSLLQAARLRGWDPRIIGHQVAAGLILYQVHAAA
jgi:hypothetical protein